jgi:NAD(P)-dependent dehydrogenase (short-subunit alcohol dehydrogenase family)
VKAFGSKPTCAEVLEGISLNGKVAVVTGGASGIGMETVVSLFNAGATVVAACRDLARAQQALCARLQTSALPSRIVLSELNLASLASVRFCAKELLKQFPEIHILVNNAATMATPHLQLGNLGYEIQFETNHIGHFLLTNLLVPALKEAASARIVCLSSSGHRQSPIRFDDVNFQLEPYKKWPAYGQSKSANALFAFELNSRLSAFGVHAFSVHPGGIMTNLQRNLSQEEMRNMGWFDESGTVHPAFKNVDQGAATSVFVATAQGIEHLGGCYFEDCAPSANAAKHIQDAHDALRLWKLSEEIVRQEFCLSFQSSSTKNAVTASDVPELSNFVSLCVQNLPDSSSMLASENHLAVKVFVPTSGSPTPPKEFVNIDVLNVSLNQNALSHLEVGKSYQLTPYCTWATGVTKVLVAKRKESHTAENFRAELSKHLFLARNVLVPQGLRGYIVYVGHDFEIALLNFESEQAQIEMWKSKESESANAHAATFLELVSFQVSH